MKRRMVSILTALALVLSLCPTWAFATEADPALCKHHLEHTEDCGYIAPTEGQPCGHEHGDECYSEETVCGHDHDESCYSDSQLPAEGEEKAADACTHTCSAESGCVTRTLDCQHVHNEECGYVEADPGTPCGYACRICPIEALIAALPGKVTEENRADVEARLQEILSLYTDLSEDEQEQIDISRCLELQGTLDEASVPMPLADTFTMNNDITISNNNNSSYNGKTLISASNGTTLTIDGTTVDLTISNLNFTGGPAGTIVLKNNAALNLTLSGSNELMGGGSTAGITVPQGCTLTISGGDADSLRVLGGEGGAGIGANYSPANEFTSAYNVGTIIINGGTIKAIGSGGGAGIGGTSLSHTGNVVINSGNVTAQGSNLQGDGGAAGIGGGYAGYLESITIQSGVVTATGGPDAAGIGAGTFVGEGGVEVNNIMCGDITISGGTVNNSIIGFGTQAIADQKKGGSVMIGVDAELPGCTVIPLPDGWASYTFNGTVYDTSITENVSAVFSIGGYRRDVTIAVNNAEPYRGSFSTTVIMPQNDNAQASLTWGGKTLTETGSSSNTTVNITFGTQRYAYYSLDITIHDERVTGDVDATVTIDGQTVTGLLKKTAEARGEIKINKIILPLDAKDHTSAVTVTAGGNAWSGNASTGTGKTLTIGQPIQPADFKLDLACGDITFADNTITYFESADAGAKTIALDSSKIYEVTQSNSGTATTHQLNINTPGGSHVRIKNVNMANNDDDYSPIEIAGKVILEISGSNSVKSTTNNVSSDRHGTGKAAIHVPSGATLELTGTGTLNAEVSSEAYYGGAGIGGNYLRFPTGNFEDSGHIIIHSGTITATGGWHAAGIGGGEDGSGTVTINGGTVTAKGGTYGAGIGSGSTNGGGNLTGTVTINGGVVTATGGSESIGSYGGAGIGGGKSGKGIVTITGGTITANAGKGAHGIGDGRDGSGGSATITGGSIKTVGAKNSPSQLVLSPKNGSGQDLSPVEITLNGAGDQAPVTGVNVTGDYGLQDVYTRDGGKLYFYLPDGAGPASVTAGGVDYVPDSEGSTNYVVDFRVSFNGYALTKQYDGTPMREPTADQVTSNAESLTFAWYQGNAAINAPVNAGSYTLRVSSDKGSKDFGVTITKRSLTITAQAQTIDYGTNISQTAYTARGLAVGDTLNVMLTASQTAPGTYSGAITASAQITRDSTDATGNYDITYTPGDLTINKIAPTVNSWPTAGAVTYGQTLGDSTLTDGDTNGTFAWKDGAVKPSAGTADYDVIFTPADPNYDTVTRKVPVTVQKAALTVKANNQTITYGGSIQTGLAQVTASGLVNGDTLTAVTVSAVAANAGTYTDGITVTGAKIGNNGTDVTANYEISYGVGDLTISPLAITVTPDSGQSKEYGADDPVLTYAVTPDLIGNDKLTGALTYEGADTGATGQHKITLGTLSAGGNYTLALSGDVMFEITKLSLATAVVTLDTASFTYDGTAKAPVVTVTKDGAVVAAGEYEISYSNTNGGAGNHTNAGTVTVTVTAKADGNYSGTNSTATFTIDPKALTPAITGTTTKTYDGTTSAPAGLSITLDGKVGSDDVTATAASYTYNNPNVTDATKITANGITLSGTAKDNYILKSNTAEIAATITKDTSATAPATGEGYTLDYPRETISITDGYEVSTANDGSGSAVPKGSITDHLGKTLYIRKVEDDNHAASGWTAFTLAARPDAPSLTKTDETLKGQKNGNLSGTTTAMEYSVDGGKTWTVCPGTALENLSGGTVMQVRVKATTADPCGAVSSHTIAEGKPITVTFDSQGGSTIEARSGLTYGSKMEKPADPAREDYEFQGWYKETGCTTEWNFVSDTLTAENVTLYAKWKKVRFSVGGTVTGNDGNSVVGGATVTLMKGSEQIDQGTTKDDGGFTFTKHVAAGAYNIVTTYAPEGKAQQIKTTLITLSDDDMTEVAVTLPPEGANSQLTVTKNSDTPAVVVGGLDDEAAALKTGGATIVTVSMEVEGKKETQVGTPVVEAIKEQVKTESSAGEPVVEYLDITVTKQVNSGSKEEVTQTTKVIEIVVPFSFSGRENIVVVRHHGGTATKLSELDSKPTSGYTDGKVYLDKANGYLYIYTNQFSTYAVGYTAQYTITFDANGGTATVTTSTTNSQGTLSSLPTNPSREGYTFKGWYTAASGGTQVTTSTVFKADTTVYAQWQQNSSGGNTPTGGGGGGGGWSGVTTYAVTVSSPAHGKVTANPVNAASGGTVTLTVTPDSGYVLDTLTVTDSRGDQVKLTDKGNGKYTFTMPSRAVTVKAVFIPVPDGAACDGGADCPSRGFTDLGTVGTWYHEAVDYVLRNGLMGGYGDGLFGPNDTLSRAQLAQILHNKEGRPIVNYLLRFDDVPSGAWYTEAVRWAASTGIVGGYGNGKYGPGDNITREQLAVMLWRYAGSPAATDRELHFADMGKASDWAEEALRWAAEKGVINGKGGGILDPAGQATRAETAQMLMNFLKK